MSDIVLFWEFCLFVSEVGTGTNALNKLIPKSSEGKGNQMINIGFTETYKWGKALCFVYISSLQVQTNVGFITDMNNYN